MRLIDADLLREEVNSWGMNDYEPSDFTDAIDDAPTVEAIPKDQYKERLKADMVSMLKELEYDLYHALCHEIHNKEDCPCTNQTTSCLATFRVCDVDRAIGRIIQQKIDKLKENINDTNTD